MSNLMKRVLAVGSASALVAAGLSAGVAPAYATGEVTIEATTGTSLTVFSTDELSLTVPVITAAVSATNLSYAITDPDQGKWYIKVGSLTAATGATNDSTITVAGKDSLGANVDIDRVTGGTQGTVALAAVADGGAAGYGDAEAELYGEIIVDFSVLTATTIFLSGIASAGASNEISISPFEGTVANGLAVVASNAAPAGNSNEYDFGDGAATATIQAWIDLNSDIDDVEANYASPVTTLNWIDPKATVVIPTAERFVNRAGNDKLNDLTAAGNLSASVQFIPAVNTDQIDIGKWKYKIEESNGDAIGAAHDFVDADFVGRLGDLTVKTGPKLYATLDAAGANFTMVTTKDYVLSVASTDAAAVWYAGAAYVPASNAGTVDQIEAVVSSTAGNHLQTDAADLTVQLRAGSSAVTYTAQTKTADAVNSTANSIQVLAVVETGAYMVTGSSVTVSGATSSLTAANTSLIVSGFTNSKGQYDVTVTSSAVASESYTITFYVLDGATDTWSKVNLIAGGGVNAVYVATYETGTATTLTADSSVLSGAPVSAGFTVTDQFGVGTNMRGTKSVSVELKSANATSLDKDATVAADGTVSFEFANYVTSGSADVVSASTYTGTSSAPTVLGGALTKTVSLYNPAAASAIQVPANLVTNVTYGDFLVDGSKATTALPAPAAGDLLLLTGTIVDANGAGVPAGVVTIAAAGFQFQQVGSTKYYNDEITVSASAAGVYNVNMWTHVANATGVSVTSTTADGKTATTTVKSYLPAAGVNGNNLVFELAMPANVVKNTTYAVVASLTDKWGNPVQTAAKVAGGVSTNAVSVQGVGSVQINSVDTATTKNFGKDGTTTVFLRSVKDIAGPGSVTVSLAVATYSATSAATATDLTIGEIATDVLTTVWDETVFANSIDASVEVLDSAADIVTTQKVNAGSFKGYVALYALGYEGQRMSAKVGNDWVIVAAIPAATNDLFRAVEFVGAGVDISVRIYIDRVLVATIPLLTK